MRVVHNAHAQLRRDSLNSIHALLLRTDELSSALANQRQHDVLPSDIWTPELLGEIAPLLIVV